MKKINILETTLRDGSYAINFSFTSADTSKICKALENAGFRYIEVGHGVGLNASNKGHGVAAQTDEEYMIAASSVLKRAKFGMFCIPGIARLEDIDLAAKHGMGFIRIGTNVTEVHKSEQFIKRAKDHGMFVTSNFMKSYALPPDKFAEMAKQSEKYGSELVYIVDSAGGMLPSELKEYYSAIRKISNIPIGFHGHDNLGLAVSNSLLAIDLGAEFVDTSLQGLGRSSGNAATELVVGILKKIGVMGATQDIDFMQVMEAGKKFIRPLMTVAGRPVLDIVSGYAEFHSSYMHFIQKYSAKYNVNPALLIIELCKVDKVHLDEEVLENIARRLQPEKEIYLGEFGFEKYFGREQDGL